MTIEAGPGELGAVNRPVEATEIAADEGAPILAAMTRTWWLGGVAHVTARRDSVLAEAIDVVFGAMSLGPRDRLPTQARTLTLDLEPAPDGRLLLFADGLPIVRVQEEHELAPTLEGMLVGFAVRTRRDAAVLHAGTVEIDGLGVLMPAGKGSGKSTLSVALGQRSARYFGDELAFVRFAERTLEAFPKAATLKQGSFSLFPEQATHIDPIRGPVRYVRPSSAAAPGEQISPGLIVFPRFEAGAAAARATPMSPAEIAFELIRQCFGGLERDRRMLALVAELSHLPAYALEYPSIDSAEQSIRAIIGGLRSPAVAVSGKG